MNTLEYCYISTDDCDVFVLSETHELKYNAKISFSEGRVLCHLLNSVKVYSAIYHKKIRISEVLNVAGRTRGGVGSFKAFEESVITSGIWKKIPI